MMFIVFVLKFYSLKKASKIRGRNHIEDVLFLNELHFSFTNN